MEFVDVVYYDSKIIVLTKAIELAEFELDGSFLGMIKLENQDKHPIQLYIDELYLYVGYDDGTVEVRNLTGNLNFLKTTSKKDPGGPGDPKITDMYSTTSYLLVNTAMNGLLIYLKPAIIFYKWIMIELETTIKAFTIFGQKLFVVTRDNEIHILDFNKQRLDEIPIGGLEHVDLEYNGKLLFVASKTRVNIYDIENSIEFVSSYQFKSSEIKSLLWYMENLLITRNDGSYNILKISFVNNKYEFEIKNGDEDPNSNFIDYQKIKRRILNRNLHENLDINKFAYLNDNRVFLGSIIP
jgi:hypothetical protein